MLCTAFISSLFAVTPTTSVNAAGNTYYVDVAGSDSNNGTSLSMPFQTIQKAADTAQAGDTVYIRGGTYRETVTPANSGSAGSPITYQNYDGETVIVSGNDIVSGWTVDSGNIYKASMNWSLGAGNQIFVDGAMMDEARWPNQTGTLVQPTRATAGSGSNAAQIVDTSLPGGDDFWNGATLWVTGGAAWIAGTTTVSDYDAATKKLTVSTNYVGYGSSYYNIGSGNKYYLSGIKGALDTEKEWWYDSAASMLYLWSPGGGSPSSHVVEAKKRMNAIDLSGKAYVEIKGIQTTAATIKMDSLTNHCLLQDMISRYISHTKVNTPAYEQNGLGIILDGSYNGIRDSELAYSSGSLVSVRGAYNNVINSYIHDGGYVPSWEGLVNLQGANSLISHNTVSNAGRVTVYFYGSMSANEIQYNDISNAGWLTTDLGMLYGPNTDGQNTEIHHNLVHDSKAATAGVGIYLDNYTNNFIVHHNVTWNNLGLQFNNPSNYNLVYNNTSWTGASAVQAFGNVFGTDMYGDRIFNNIIKGYDAETAAYTVYGSNLTASPGFVNETARDYHLLSNSGAVDTGIVIPGITDGYVGSAPDIGAYEYGGTDWTAGHNFANPPSPAYTPPSTTYMNRVTNGGFEKGDLSGWTKTDANNAVTLLDGHWGKAANAGMSRSQFYGVKLSGGVDGVEQTITGLQPNTDYIAGGWLRTPAGETAELGVKGYGGADLSAASTSSTWTFKTIRFTTGASNTTATITFKKTSATGEAYVDDAGLVMAEPIVYQSLYTSDGFENGLSNWAAVQGKGTPSTSSAVTHSGSSSYVINEDMDAISQLFNASYNKIVKMWFYDNGSTTNMQMLGMVNDAASIRGIGVNTPTSTSKYVVRINGTYYATGATRTTGWHEFKWDYSSGTGLDMSIDGTIVNQQSGPASFDRITIGDLWSGSSNSAYFDDISIMDPSVPPSYTADDFESGLGNWTAVAGKGTPSLSTAQAHSGSYSYVIDQDMDVIAHSFTSSYNKIVTMWFYDNAADTSLQTIGDVNDSILTRALGVNTPTSATKYVTRLGSTYAATTVTRTTGWHEFKWDYTSGTKVDMYIDGTLVASPTGVTSFNQISMGDWWSSNTGLVYFDDVSIQ
ncbi:hypothetical protein DL346_17395 [Paenibacillus montanisoli]|uniref:Right handed beta helix domain-containing protein n=1 Tax=Paenibacillus montanisoli TaxID=2081970 RepID=A0A328TXE4_9BACL|nr:hypothetical protein DL346_17395 [Paenibacillus montanisoli]